MNKPRRSRIPWPALAILALALPALALALPALAQAPPIALGPYVQNVGTDNATICWATLDAQLDYNPASLDRQTASRVYNYHRLTLRGLQPGAAYTYDVLGDGSDAGKGSFTTFAAAEHPFSFVTIADCHNQTGAAIVKLAAAGRPDMVFLPGDMTYEGRTLFHWEDFLRVNRDLMRRVPYYPAPGNHEHVGATSPYRDLFALPGNQRYYSFDRGTTHFVVLDSAGLYQDPDNQSRTAAAPRRFADDQKTYWQTQLAWLKDDLAARQGAKYIFVFFHHPLYTSYALTQDSARKLRKRFGSVFQDYRVSAVFNGHDHHYNHALVGGVHFVMTCAGGEPLGADSPRPETIKCWKPHNFARIDVGPDRAHLRATDVTGNIIEEFDIPPRAVSGQ